MAIKKISGTKAKGLRGRTDWGKVKSTTDDEIKKESLLDKNTKEFRPDELMKFKREKK